MSSKRIYFTVTNDLNHDQRMIRICSTLQDNGYDVTLIGRKRQQSAPLTQQNFKQKRIACLFEKGKMFYLEYNIRLFFFLLFQKFDGICAIDLDTILPCLWVSKLKKVTRIYDAHELFCEMKEVRQRPSIYRIWKRIEKYAVPKFQHAYTVNSIIANKMKDEYGIEVRIIRNISIYHDDHLGTLKQSFILYQGAVNEGRCFETLIPAMKKVSWPLIICGDGNFMKQAKQLVAVNGLEQKVIFKGMVAPSELRKITSEAGIGITLFDRQTDNNYLSLANRFFDYIHGGTPQLCMNYPAYAELNNKYDIAVMIDNTDSDSIAHALNQLIQDNNLRERLHQNCRKASKELCWQHEAPALIQFYESIFGKTSSHSNA